MPLPNSEQNGDHSPKVSREDNAKSGPAFLINVSHRLFSKQSKKPQTANTKHSLQKIVGKHNDDHNNIKEHTSDSRVEHLERHKQDESTENCPEITSDKTSSQYIAGDSKTDMADSRKVVQCVNIKTNVTCELTQENDKCECSKDTVQLRKKRHTNTRANNRHAVCDKVVININIEISDTNTESISRRTFEDSSSSILGAAKSSTINLNDTNNREQAEKNTSSYSAARRQAYRNTKHTSLPLKRRNAIRLKKNRRIFSDSGVLDNVADTLFSEDDDAFENVNKYPNFAPAELTSRFSEYSKCSSMEHKERENNFNTSCSPSSPIDNGVYASLNIKDNNVHSYSDTNSFSNISQLPFEKEPPNERVLRKRFIKHVKKSSTYSRKDGTIRKRKIIRPGNRCYNKTLDQTLNIQPQSTDGIKRTSRRSLSDSYISVIFPGKAADSHGPGLAKTNPRHVYRISQNSETGSFVSVHGVQSVSSASGSESFISVNAGSDCEVWRMLSFRKPSETFRKRVVSSCSSSSESVVFVKHRHQQCRGRIFSDISMFSSSSSSFSGISTSSSLKCSSTSSSSESVVSKNNEYEVFESDESKFINKQYSRQKENGDPAAGSISTSQQSFLPEFGHDQNKHFLMFDRDSKIVNIISSDYDVFASRRSLLKDTRKCSMDSPIHLYDNICHMFYDNVNLCSHS